MEQRQFKRIHFLQGVSVDADGEHYDTHCLDISLRGILLARPDHAPWRKGQAVTVTLTLAPEQHIIMQCTLVHLDDAVAGCLCETTDIDSLTELRRLLELNLANPQELHRELAELIRGTV